MRSIVSGVGGPRFAQLRCTRADRPLPNDPARPERQTGPVSSPTAATSEPRDRTDRWDILVVGAGPAGSTAALAALRERPGARVALLDAARFPRDKSCGDGIA